MVINKSRIPSAAHILAGLVTGALLIAVWLLSGYQPRVRHGDDLAPLAFTHDGRVLAAGTLIQDGILMTCISPIRLLNTEDGSDVEPPWPTLVAPLAGNPPIPRTILQAEFSPDGKLLAVVQEHHDVDKERDKVELILLERATRDPIAVLAVPYSRFAGRGSIAKTLFSPDSKLVGWCAAQDDQAPSVVVWDIEQQQQRFALADATYPVISPDSKLLATVESNRGKKYGQRISLKLSETASGDVRQSITLLGAAEGWQPWPSFSLDGSLVAVNSRHHDGKQSVEVFETATGNGVFARSLTFSPHFLGDGKTLVTVQNRDVQLWDTKTWRQTASLRFNLGTHWSSGSEISPDPDEVPGTSLVAVFNYYPRLRVRSLEFLGKSLRLNLFGSNRVALIDGATARRQAVELHDSLLLVRACWSPDGSKAAFGTMEGRLSIWDIPPRKSLVPLFSVLAIVLGLVGLVQAWNWLRLPRATTSNRP